MSKGFTLRHQEIGAKSISIESKIRKKLLRATSTNNRCSNWQAIEKATEFRANLIEAAVEMDDVALEGFLEGKEPDEDTLRKLIRKATVTRAFYPMMCGSAFKPRALYVCRSKAKTACRSEPLRSITN